MCKAGGCARLRHAAMGRGEMQSTALHATGANPAMPPQPHWAPAACSAGAGAAGFCQADGWWRVGLGAVGRRGARTGNANTFSACPRAAVAHRREAGRGPAQLYNTEYTSIHINGLPMCFLKFVSILCIAGMRGRWWHAHTLFAGQPRRRAAGRAPRT